MAAAYSLVLVDGPAAGERLNYAGVPKILVVCRGGRWHDYRRLVDAAQFSTRELNNYRHSENCKCR